MSDLIHVTMNCAPSPIDRWDNATRGEGFAWNAQWCILVLQVAKEQSLHDQMMFDSLLKSWSDVTTQRAGAELVRSLMELDQKLDNRFWCNTIV